MVVPNGSSRLVAVFEICCLFESGSNLAQENLKTRFFEALYKVLDVDL